MQMQQNPNYNSQFTKTKTGKYIKLQINGEKEEEERLVIMQNLINSIYSQTSKFQNCNKTRT